MSGKSNDHQPWLGKAESILSTVEELSRSIHARVNRQGVSDKYRALKEHIRQEATLAKKKDGSKLTGAELDYSAMISKVSGDLRSPVNCDPFAGQLRDELGWIQVDLSDFVGDYKGDSDFED